VIFYKYVKRQRFLDELDRYLNGELYFADKQKFNDKREHHPLDRFKANSDRIASEPAYKKEIEDCKQYLDKFKICCLTKHYDDNTMWGSYGQDDGAEGVCIIVH
jgi:hypothetical protein